MKLRVGDIVRVKTKEELAASGLLWDWDLTYKYSQGALGIVKKIERIGEHFRYYLKFDMKKIFDVNQFCTLEEEQKESIVIANEEIPFEIKELVILKNKSIMLLE